jgi:asparagine synthase (glutamine-hydrolysing)
MSAFFGIWNLDGRPVDIDFLQRASRILVQRGPDSHATYAKDTFGMVDCAFHVTKESRQAVQPHVSPGGLIVGWNGRLDNRHELINDLAQARLVGSADVVIAGMNFEKWGNDSFAKLLGDWALSVWNPSRKTLVLARDYIGIRHLYYYVGPRECFGPRTSKHWYCFWTLRCR